MAEVTLAHFERAAADIGAHGDNDTLPFDIDNRFMSEKQDELAGLAYDFYQQLQSNSVSNSKQRIAAISVFNERLLAPSGPAGFRVSTKIQTFWNLYFNGLVSPSLTRSRAAEMTARIPTDFSETEELISSTGIDLGGHLGSGPPRKLSLLGPELSSSRLTSPASTTTFRTTISRMPFRTCFLKTAALPHR